MVTTSSHAKCKLRAVRIEYCYTDATTECPVYYLEITDNYTDGEYERSERPDTHILETNKRYFG